MKKFFTLLVLAACCAAMTWGCSDDKYDDTEIRQDTTIVFLLISAIVRYPAHYSTCPIPSSSKKDSKRKVKAYRSEPIGAPGHIIRNKIVKYRLSYRPGNLRKRPLFFIFVALECIFNTFGSKYITFGHFITFRI